MQVYGLDSDYIRELMGSKGWDVDYLAYALGIAPMTLKRILGQGVAPRDLTERISKTLCVDIEDITQVLLANGRPERKRRRRMA